MTDRPARPADREQPDTSAEVDPDVAELLGLRPSDAGSVPTADEVDTLGEMTDTRVYQGDLEARPPDSDQPDEDPLENIESLTATELRDGETDDPNEAAEEGLTWIPPTDPPLRVDDDGPEIAAGFGLTSTDEPYDEDHHAAALFAFDEVEARVVEALRADAATSRFADSIEVEVEGAHVILDGTVDDLDDEDAAVDVAGRVDGVLEVTSRLRLRDGLGTEPARRAERGP